MASTDATKVETLVMYKKCIRNHAAPDKGYLLFDGCCLFKSRSESASDDALLCAACNCHRSFHRRVQLDLPPQYSSANFDQRHQPGSDTVIVHREPASAPPQAVAARRQTPTMSPTPTSPSTDSAAADRAQQEAPTHQGASAVWKKRITREEREMLRALCDRNNWKMFREYSPEEVVRICSDIGISRTALKSWISLHRRKRLAAIRFN